MSWDCQSAEYTMKLNNSDLPQEKRRSQEMVCSLLGRQLKKNKTVYLKGGIFYG